ncbi:Spy/CpxP family protein refolding chaperone [Amphritea sp. HPY]|uniref:Spy/CpxP family protein refolding chaperone n=1 Tax=Amphritea sp. HPY TaxID=3421652 RepID=UPI003D7DFBA0
MRKQLIIGITAAVIGAGTLAAGVAQADRSWGEHERCDSRSEKHERMSERMDKRAEKRMDYLSEELSLSQQQQDQIDDLFDQNRSDMKKQMRGMRDMRKQMKSLDVSASDYDQQVETIVEQAQDKAAKLIRARAEQKKALYALLTPEQQEQFNALHK